MKLAGGFGKLAIAAAAAFAAIQAGKAILNVLDGLATRGDKISKSSKGIGLTAQQYQELDFAMKKSGVSMDTSANAFAKLARVVRDSADGSKMATEKLGRLGISATDASGAARSTFDVFLDITDAISGMGNATERTAVALDFFEESGFKLIPLLSQGSAGLKKMADEAHRVGAVMGGEALDAAVRYKDASLRLDMAWETFLGNFAAPFMDAASRVMDGMSGVGRSSNQMTNAFLAMRHSASNSVAAVATATEKATNRILKSLAGQAQGMAQALNTTAISAQFSAMIASRGAQAQAVLAEWNRAIKSAEASGVALGTLEGMRSNAAKAGKAAEREIEALKAQAQAAMAAENRLIQVRIGAVRDERLIVEGQTESQIALGKQRLKVAKEIAIVKAAETKASTDGTTASQQSLEAAQSNLELSEFNAGKITQERSSLLMTIAENKHRGELVKISKAEKEQAEGTAQARRDSAKSALDEMVARPQAVPLGVSFDLDSMFDDIARQFGGLGARLHAEGERVIAEALGAGAITDVEAQLARETMLVESRLALMTQLGEGLAEAGAAASGSADETVAAIGRMSTALGQNAGAIAKGGASAIAASGRVAAQLTDDVRLQAAIQGAFETAAGFADLAKPNPLGAGLHFASAGLFFALAATGAKGGGGAQTGGGQAGATATGYDEAVAPEGGGVSATTVIFNAPILAGDSQEAAQQISDVMSGNVGTGMQGGAI